MQNSTTGDTYSVVSDYLVQGNGYFRLLLPAGLYTLHATVINAAFTGASSVGPFSKTAAPDQTIPTVSFNSDQLLNITVGKATTVKFVNDGTGTYTSDNAMTTGNGASTGSGGNTNTDTNTTNNNTNTNSSGSNPSTGSSTYGSSGGGGGGGEMNPLTLDLLVLMLVFGRMRSIRTELRTNQKPI